jgi:hypothetical protein
MKWLLAVILLLFISGCRERIESSYASKQPEKNLPEDEECIVKDGLVESISGIKINYPDSEGLTGLR